MTFEQALAELRELKTAGTTYGITGRQSSHYFYFLRDDGAMYHYYVHMEGDVPVLSDSRRTVSDINLFLLEAWEVVSFDDWREERIPPTLYSFEDAFRAYKAGKRIKFIDRVWRSKSDTHPDPFHPIQMVEDRWIIEGY